MGYTGSVKTPAKALRVIILAALALVAAVSCRTMNDAQVAELAARTASEADAGDVDALVGGSGAPFLFETEILASPALLEALWSGLAASGYSLAPRGEIVVMDVDAGTADRFSSSEEVRLWFEHRLPGTAALAVYPVDDGRVLLIIDRDKDQAAPLRGLKVEQGS